MSRSQGRGPVVRLVRRVADPHVRRTRSDTAIVDAVVVEDDTYHVLSPLPVVAEEHAPSKWLLRRALDLRPAQPGSVEIEAGEPVLRLVAVIYDLEEEPPAREEWVAAALGEILREAKRLGVKTLALPLLGCRLGGLGAERFAELYALAIDSIGGGSLREIWLLAPEEMHEVVSRALRGLGVEVRKEDSR